MWLRFDHPRQRADGRRRAQEARPGGRDRTRGLGHRVRLAIIASSFPRKRESRQTSRLLPWTPAFAGVTISLGVERDSMGQFGIGQAVRRKEDVRFITGR